MICALPLVVTELALHCKAHSSGLLTLSCPESITVPTPLPTGLPVAVKIAACLAPCPARGRGRHSRGGSLRSFQPARRRLPTHNKVTEEKEPPGVPPPPPRRIRGSRAATAFQQRELT
ncbi:hypothetical protein NDU88_001373 [Pleurodeles waltl]|uniref:Secreted protein n=1 Tax=Pleurodeles waltl TaxID=8319 RepID=A0AAV7TI41_PLEWA|nr:hypothetical protein NDU88_001373 [Pleurodeles waltl]